MRRAKRDGVGFSFDNNGRNDLQTRRKRSLVAAEASSSAHRRPDQLPPPPPPPRNHKTVGRVVKHDHQTYREGTADFTGRKLKDTQKHKWLCSFPLSIGDCEQSASWNSAVLLVFRHRMTTNVSKYETWGNPGSRTAFRLCSLITFCCCWYIGGIHYSVKRNANSRGTWKMGPAWARSFKHVVNVCTHTSAHFLNSLPAWWILCVVGTSRLQRCWGKCGRALLSGHWYCVLETRKLFLKRTFLC